MTNKMKKINFYNPMFLLQKEREKLRRADSSDGLSYHKQWVIAEAKIKFGSILRTQVKEQYKFKPQLVKTRRGELARSFSEMLFSDALFSMNLNYSSEVRVIGLREKESRMMCDYLITFLKEDDAGNIIPISLYIELWGGGQNQKKYDSQKVKKEALYSELVSDHPGEIFFLGMEASECLYSNGKPKYIEDIVDTIQKSLTESLGLEFMKLKKDDILSRIKLLKMI